MMKIVLIKMMNKNKIKKQITPKFKKMVKSLFLEILMLNKFLAMIMDSLV